MVDRNRSWQFPVPIAAETSWLAPTSNGPTRLPGPLLLLENGDVLGL